MKLIDIIIFSLCVIGLIYFFFDRLKYRNISVYHKKLERLNELKKIITAIESEDKDTENIIRSTNFDAFFEEKFTDRLINYRDNDLKLSYLKNELKEIELYIKNFRMYNKKIGI
jgi:hypothetical protein